MLAIARSKNVRISPYKLRPYAKVIRGKSVEQAHAWLKNCGIKRVTPMLKTLASAYANVRHKYASEYSARDVVVKEIRIDQGAIVGYFKPAAMGRAMPQRKRLCHIMIVLDKAK